MPNNARHSDEDLSYLGDRWREAGALAGFDAVVRQGPGLFLFAVGAVLAAAFGLAAIFWYLTAPRLAQWSAVLPTVTLAALSAAALYILLEYLGLLLTVYGGRDFTLPLGRGRRTVLRITPLARRVARLVGVGGDRLIHSFVEVSNAATRARLRRAAMRSSGPVLVLLPRCIQRPECTQAIAEDVENCRRCGQCVVAEILALRDDYDDVVMAVLTGGSLAPGLIKRLEPRAVVGVACERELFDGIAAVGDRPVIGVANQRPVGPCRGTFVEVAELSAALDVLAVRTPK